MRTKVTNHTHQHNQQHNQKRFKIDINKSITSTINTCLQKHSETLELNRDNVAILLINVVLLDSEAESQELGAKPGDFLKNLENGLLPMSAHSEIYYGKLRSLIIKQEWSILQKMSILRVARRVYNRSKPGEIVLIFDETGIPGRCGVRVSRIRF